ncbi:MAG: NAD(P)H-hydrate dehydratase [Deltaproteobacteria bacterium]|nr:MAG: NAD(P)H-hydrate dehydratase [Deltaproteobacteria bacterium]
MAALDRRAIDSLGIPGMVLMERASLVCADALERLAPGAPSLILAGPGNNGGDGSCIARIRRCRGHRATILTLGDPNSYPPDASANLEIARRAGCEIAPASPDRLRAELHQRPVVVDALFGIGLSGTLPREVVQLLDIVRREHDGTVLAVDVPSGVHSDTGSCDPGTLSATHTVAMGALKWCHVLGDGAERCGTVEVADIGLPRCWLDEAAAATIVDRRMAGTLVPQRSRNVHKGCSGTILLRAGSPKMPGAAVLAALGAVMTGTGLLSVDASEDVLSLVLRTVPECVAAHSGRQHDVVLIGPGRGTSDEAAAELESTVTEVRGPLVLDADALNLMAARGLVGSTEHWSAILTPHPAELARLLGVELADVLGDLPGAAMRAARMWNAVVVAKTAGAVIAAPDGPVYFVEPGSSKMASAGCGDVLAGIIAALRPHLPPLESAILGCWVHAAAGHAAALATGSLRVRAQEVARNVPSVLSELGPR